MKFRKERSETGSCFKKRKAAGKKKIVIGTAVALTVSVATGGVYWKYQSGKRSVSYTHLTLPTIRLV